MKFFYWFARSLCKGFFLIFHRHKVFGSEHLPIGPCIIAPNHASFYDPPLVGVSCEDEVAFLARKTLFDNVFVGRLIPHLNAYPISGNAQDLSSFKVICKLLLEQKKVVIFPEGSRTRSGDLSIIKSGIGMLALRSKCPIIPTYIHGTFQVWPRYYRFPRLFGKTACVFGSPIIGDNFIQMGKKEAQEEIAKCVNESIQNLKEWYLSGAEGLPP